MNISRSIQLQNTLEPSMDKAKIVAHVEFNSKKNSKKVSVVELDAPIRLTSQYVDVKNIPFIHAYRKAKSEFNFLSSNGSGIFLCESLDQLHQVLVQIDRELLYVLSDMQDELNNMETTARKTYSFSHFPTR